MLSSDWSLVLFTILIQTAVGMLVISEIGRLKNGTEGHAQNWQAPSVCLLAALGLVMSLSHLGTPSHSVFTILNLGTSWLSREILTVGGFFGLVLVLTVMRRKNPASGTPVAVAAMIVGLIAIAVMTNVYLLKAVPGWNTVATALSFFGTTLLAGSVATGVIIRLENRQMEPESAGIPGILVFASLLGLTIQVIAIALGMLALGVEDNAGGSALSMIAQSGQMALAARIAMICAGAGLFAWVGGKAMAAKQPRFVTGYTVSALVLVLTGEVIGRLMFYGTYMRIGL